jgi:hypothetical protein
LILLPCIPTCSSDGRFRFRTNQKSEFLYETHQNLILAAVFVLFVATMLFAGAQDFTIQNSTGQTITHLYISSTAPASGEESILGAGVLPDGQSRHIPSPASAISAHSTSRREPLMVRTTR